MFEIKNGDSLDVLKTIPSESVQCIITSPPYYGLRDYGHEDAIGLEETLDDYLERLIAVLDECRRILKPEGTLWLNLGDSYAGSGRGAGSTDGAIQGGSQGTHGLKRDKTRADYKLDPSSLQANSRGSLKAPQAKGRTPVRRKSLLGVPWRIALMMIEDGWILRSDTIWAKKAPMPESVKDRPTRAHEYCFMFTKSEKYLYNWLDVAEPMKLDDSRGGLASGSKYADPMWQEKFNDLKRRQLGMNPVRGSIGADGGGKGYSRYASGNPNDKASKAFADADKRRYHDATKVKYPHADPVKKAKEDARKRKHHAATKVGGTYYSKGSQSLRNHHEESAPDDNPRPLNPVDVSVPYRDGVPVRNRWSYQIVASSMSYEGHYALFPVSSIIPLVLASTNEGDTVLDPFSGMATTGLAAIRHNRKYIGVEINPDYAETSRQRLIGDAPLLQHMNA